MHSCLLLCPLIVDEIDVSSPASIAAELFFASQNGRTPAMMHGRSIFLPPPISVIRRLGSVTRAEQRRSDTELLWLRRPILA
jgi:hypothetical protein